MHIHFNKRLFWHGKKEPNKMLPWIKSRKQWHSEIQHDIAGMVICCGIRLLDLPRKRIGSCCYILTMYLIVVGI